MLKCKPVLKNKSGTSHRRAPAEGAMIFKLVRIAFLSQIMILLTIMISCSDKQKVQNTKNLIPEKKLIPLIVDIHMIDAYMTLRMNDSLNFEPKKLNNAVFKNHDITREKFNETIQFYSQSPQLLDSLYEKILVRMSEMKAETMDKKKEAETKK